MKYLKNFLKKYRFVVYVYRKFFKRKNRQTWASMNWKDWSGWVMSKINKYYPNAKEILEIGGQGNEMGNFIIGKKFRTLNFPEEDICKKNIFSSRKI